METVVLKNGKRVWTWENIIRDLLFQGNSYAWFLGFSKNYAYYVDIEGEVHHMVIDYWEYQKRLVVAFFPEDREMVEDLSFVLGYSSPSRKKISGGIVVFEWKK